MQLPKAFVVILVPSGHLCFWTENELSLESFAAQLTEDNSAFGTTQHPTQFCHLIHVNAIRNEFES